MGRAPTKSTDAGARRQFKKGGRIRQSRLRMGCRNDAITTAASTDACEPLPACPAPGWLTIQSKGETSLQICCRFRALRSRYNRRLPGAGIGCVPTGGFAVSKRR